MKDALKVYGPLALISLLLIVIAMRFVAPPPPKTITFAAGGKDGQYYELATQYRDRLEAFGLTVEVLETAGTLENYDKLATGQADVALLQGGVEPGTDVEGIESLGGMFPEPFWIFVRSDLEATDFGDLRGALIAGGVAGSGTRALAEEMQSLWGGAWNGLRPLSGLRAADALVAGEVDAAVFAASIQAPYVERLLNDETVTVLPVRRAKAVSMRDAALTPVTLYEGAVDMARNVPAQDLSLIAAVAQLGVREDLHPAIQSVLLEAAEPIHAQGSLLTRGGIYPDASQTDLPLSEEARRYYRNGPTFLRRYFSFGVANFLERAWVFLIPLITLLIPLVQVAPPVYRWRIRRKIYVWYNDLHELERRGFDAETNEGRDRKSVV